jgi:hypothetical protein
LAGGHFPWLEVTSGAAAQLFFAGSKPTPQDSFVSSGKAGLFSMSKQWSAAGDARKGSLNVHIGV